MTLVRSESRGKTAALGGPNSDGSYEYGLFQMSVPHNGSCVRTQLRRELKVHSFLL
jgi:hypothetical protein